MSCTQRRKRRDRSGVAYILALLMLALCTSFAVAFSSSTNLEVQRGSTYRKMLPARLAVESGMDFAIWAMSDVESNRYLTEVPDMAEVLRAHFATKLPNQTVTLVEGNGTAANPRKITVSSTPLSANQNFSFELIVTATDAVNNNVPSEMELVVTGVSGDISRKAGVMFAVGEDKSLLNYAVASAVRAVVRGNNTVIDGGIVSSWDRVVGKGERANVDDIAWPLDFGNTDDGDRALENIQINGSIATTMSQDEFESAYDGESAMSAIRDADLRGKIEYDAPDPATYTADDFDTSAIRDRPEAPVGQVALAGQKRTLPFSAYSSGDLNNTNERLLTIRAGRFEEDPVPQSTDERVMLSFWAGGYIFARAFYAGHNDDNGNSFSNLHVPKGTHAYFQDCTFKGITYIEVDETINLTEDDADNILSGMDGSGTNKSNTDTVNNIIFENCRFEGPVVTGVPRNFRYWQNCLNFLGDTTFVGSAIEEEMPGVTVMAPNFNVAIGDLDEGEVDSSSEISGLIVAGILDLRDNATVNGTILSMANLDWLDDDDVWKWGTNIGNWEDSAEDFPGSGYTPSGFVTITPNPDNVIPGGMKKSYTMLRVSGSYTEYSFD